MYRTIETTKAPQNGKLLNVSQLEELKFDLYLDEVNHFIDLRYDDGSHNGIPFSLDSRVIKFQHDNDNGTEQKSLLQNECIKFSQSTGRIILEMFLENQCLRYLLLEHTEGLYNNCFLVNKLQATLKHKEYKNLRFLQ